MFATADLARAAGIGAIGLATLTASGDAWSQTPIVPSVSREDVYAPPPPSASAYRPNPVIAYTTASSAQSNVTGFVTQSDSRHDDRLITLGFITGLALVFTSVFFYLVRPERKNEEKDKKG